MKSLLAAVSFLSLSSLAWSAVADEGVMAKSVRRLERAAPEYPDLKDIDKTFLSILNLTEKTKQGQELNEETRRIAANPALVESRYMDSLLYYMFVKAAAASKEDHTDVDYWLTRLETHENSQHVLAARLIRLHVLPQNSSEVLPDIQRIVDWVRHEPSTFTVRAPDYVGSQNRLVGMGNRLFGADSRLSTKPRSDFTGEEPQKMYSLSLYKKSVAPLPGFLAEETYVALLDRVKQGHEDTLTEMASIYERAKKKKEAANALYDWAKLRAAAGDLKKAKDLLDEAVAQDPANVVVQKERDKVKLDMTYQSLNPTAAPKPAAPDQPSVSTATAATPSPEPAPSASAVTPSMPEPKAQ